MALARHLGFHIIVIRDASGKIQGVRYDELAPVGSSEKQVAFRRQLALTIDWINGSNRGQ
jgi:hypothetical protein